MFNKYFENYIYSNQLSFFALLNQETGKTLQIFDIGETFCTEHRILFLYMLAIQFIIFELTFLMITFYICVNINLDYKSYEKAKLLLIGWLIFFRTIYDQYNSTPFDTCEKITNSCIKKRNTFL